MLLPRVVKAAVQGQGSRSALLELFELNGKLGCSGGSLAGDDRMAEFGKDPLR